MIKLILYGLIGETIGYFLGKIAFGRISISIIAVGIIIWAILTLRQLRRKEKELNKFMESIKQ